MQKNESQKTILILAAASLAGFFVFHKDWFIVLSLLLLIAGITSAKASAVIARAWHKFGMLLGAVNSRIILVLVYYLILTPIAFLYRIFNTKSSAYFKDNKLATAFIEADKEYPPDNFEKMW